MSERSSISLSEVLGDNYYIDKLTSSDYSPSVGDTVTITLLVKDVFGDPVTGQTRTVTCTEGSFVSVNGSSITASSSVEVTTGSGGTVTLGLSVNVADVITVSNGKADCVVCSLSTITNNIGTFEKVAENTTYELWVNTTTRCARIICHRTNITIGSGESFTNYSDFTIPSAYRPKKSFYRLIMRSNQFIFYLYDNGTYGIYNLGSSVSGYNLSFQIDYTF